MFAHAAGMSAKNLDKDMDKFIEEHAFDKVYDEKGKLIEFGVPVEYSSRYNFMSKTCEHSLIFADLLPKMTLVSLVSLFDAYLARLIRTLFKIKPHLLNSSEKQIKFSELLEFENIDDAKEHIVGLEIETILRTSHSDQFKWLEDKIGIPLRELPAWKIFVEITERRNLFVHADGIVNKQYSAACKSAGFKVNDDCEIGTKLDVPPKYYEEACDCVAEIGVKLAQVTWRKLLPKQIDSADNSLISVTYNFLSTSNYELALTLCKLCELPAVKNSCLEHTYYLKLNQAIALKGLKMDDAVKELLDSVDWSVLSEKFKLAEAVLRDDRETAANLMVKIGSRGDINRLCYIEWPLFRWFRKTEEFKNAFKEVFGEEFKIIGKVKEADDLKNKQISSKDDSSCPDNDEQDYSSDTQENMPDEPNNLIETTTEASVD